MVSQYTLTVAVAFATALVVAADFGSLDTASLGSLDLNKCVVDVEQGTIQGQAGGAVSGQRVDSNSADGCEFLGIPFAAPPVGALRFKPPQPAHNFSHGPFYATRYGPGCIQSCRLQHPELTCPRSISEDCLSLNVYTPPGSIDKQGRKKNDQKAVMVFFHGGNYIGGSGGVLLYHGSLWAAREDIIIVTTNYRLGALGGLYTRRGDVQGNFQLQDQRMALRWVSSNIQAFGGDPSRVTIYGQSAGAFSVASHLASPPSWPFFSSAIVLSDPVALPTETVRKSEQISKILVEKLGCSRIIEADEDACLRGVRAADILKAQQETSFPTMPGDILHKFMPWTPVIDPVQMPMSPYEAAKQNKLRPNTPIFIGTVANESVQFIWEASSEPMSVTEYDVYVAAIFGIRDAEKIFKLYGKPPAEMAHNKDVRLFLATLGTDYIFTCAVQSWAELVSKHRRDVWVYYYEHVLSYNNYLQGDWIPECRGELVCHGVDLPVLFDVVHLSPDSQKPAPSNKEKRLSKHMQHVYANFAKNGEVATANGNKVFPRFESGERASVVFSTTEDENHDVVPPQNRTESSRVVNHFRSRYCEVFDKVGYEVN